MGSVYGPNMVTDDLVLALDATNVQSYPGSGSTWYNLAGTQNTTLYNSPTHSTSNGGYLQFNGSTQYADTNMFLVDDITWSLWHSVEDTNTNRILDVTSWNSSSTDFFEFKMTDAYNTNDIEQWAYSYVGGSRADFHTGTNASHRGVDIWTNTVVAIGGGLGYTYQDGVNLGSDSAFFKAFTGASGQFAFQLARARFYYLNSAAWQYGKTKISMFNVWHKRLSHAEVLQNYNAHKSRFSL